MTFGKEIRGCARCGSLDIRPATASDGVLPGVTELSMWVCRACGHRGTELLFDDEEARLAYVRAAAGDEDAPTFTRHGR